MSEPAELPAWKEELDAIVGARAYGQFEEILPRLRKLDAKYPNVAEIAYQVAWTAETLGRPAEAVPHYEKAIALGLPPNELSGAYVGLGASLRAAGQAARAVEVLRNAKLHFPENREFDAFLTLALHDTGAHAEALAGALELVCDTSDDPGLTTYQRALRHAAAKLRTP